MKDGKVQWKILEIENHGNIIAQLHGHAMLQDIFGSLTKQ